MEQMKIQLSASSIYVLSGNLETRKSNKKCIMYLNIEPRVLSIQNNEVSSVAPIPCVAVKEITDTIKRHCPNTCARFFPRLLAVVSPQDNESLIKIFEISKLEAVKRKGKTVIKMNASSNKLDASGKYAENSINLYDIPQGAVTITCYVWLRTVSCDTWK